MRLSLVVPILVVLLAAAPPAAATVGGGPAAGEVPYIAAIEGDSKRGPFEFVCGGTLVSPDRVMTSASCVSQGDETPVQPATVRVQLGTKVRSQGGERIAVTRLELHPAYDAGSFSHDVAVLTLARKSTLGRPIRIADPGREQGLWKPGAVQRVVGWGDPKDPERPSTDVLQQIRVPRVDDRGCTDRTASTFRPEVMLCAGESQTGGQQDVCGTDKGGPMTAATPDGEVVQTGIISFYFGCSNPPSDAVYARVADRVLYDWVQARLPAGGPPAPGAGPSPGGTAPRATLARRVLGSGRLRLRCGAVATTASACRVRIARSGGRVLRTVRLRPGRPTVVRVSTRRSLTLRATVTTPKGRLTVTRTLRRGR